MESVKKPDHTVGPAPLIQTGEEVRTVRACDAYAIYTNADPRNVAVLRGPHRATTIVPARQHPAIPALHRLGGVLCAATRLR